MNPSPLRDFLVGLFVLAGLAAVAYLSIGVGGFQYSAGETITIYAPFEEIAGLKPRAPVMISGVKVGVVDSIALDEYYRARVEMTVDAAVEIPWDTSASIVTSGILGDRYVLLELGGDSELLEDGDELQFTESALILERLVGKLIHDTSLGDEN